MSEITSTSTLDTNPGSPARRHGPTYPTSPYDALPLPGGKTLGQTETGALTRFLVAAGVPGANHTNGRETNAKFYSEHLSRIQADAGKAAVASWLQGIAP